MKEQEKPLSFDDHEIFSSKMAKFVIMCIKCKSNDVVVELRTGKETYGLVFRCEDCGNRTLFIFAFDKQSSGEDNSVFRPIEGIEKNNKEETK